LPMSQVSSSLFRACLSSNIDLMNYIHRRLVPLAQWSEAKEQRRNNQDDDSQKSIDWHNQVLKRFTPMNPFELLSPKDLSSMDLSYRCLLIAVLNRDAQSFEFCLENLNVDWRAHNGFAVAQAAISPSHIFRHLIGFISHQILGDARDPSAIKLREKSFREAIISLDPITQTNSLHAVLYAWHSRSQDVKENLDILLRLPCAIPPQDFEILEEHTKQFLKRQQYALEEKEEEGAEWSDWISLSGSPERESLQ